MFPGNGLSTILRRGTHSISHTALPVTSIHDNDINLNGSVMENNLDQSNDAKMSVYLTKVLNISDNESVTQTLLNIKDNSTPQNLSKTAQFRNLSHDAKPTISEVYYERKIGLGLAPSLLKILSLDKNVAKETKTNWLSSSVLKKFGSSDVTQKSTIYGELYKRDEGDGRSIAESQSSTGSYKKINDMSRLQNFESLIEEDNHVKEPNKRLKKKLCAPPPLPDASMKPISDS